MRHITCRLQHGLQTSCPHKSIDKTKVDLSAASLDHSTLEAFLGHHPIATVLDPNSIATSLNITFTAASPLSSHSGCQPCRAQRRGPRIAPGSRASHQKPELWEWGMAQWPCGFSFPGSVPWAGDLVQWWTGSASLCFNTLHRCIAFTVHSRKLGSYHEDC